MECDICHSFTSKANALDCPACARAALYPMRLKLAEALLAKESTSKQVSSVLAVINGTSTIQGVPKDSVIQVQEAAKQHKHKRTLSEIKEARNKIDQVVMQSKKLEEQIEVYKKDIEARKAAATERRKRQRAAGNEATYWPTKNVEPLEKMIRRGHRKYDSLFAQIISDRVYLCKEAAALAGLKQYKQKASDGSIVDTYWIGGIPIIDLQDINNASPQRLTASLTHICHLVKLTCNYLHIQLPSEITLPHNNYPLPTIFGPSSSYQGRQVPFPPINPSTSPTNSRMLDSHEDLPRPRPLYISKKLPQLFREDPARYVLFIEAISLLAWDIVWLCRTQGLPVASSEWEEVCSIGKNLFSLFVETPRKPRPPLNRRGTSEKDTSSPASTLSKQSRTNKPEPFSSLGVLSHGSSHNFLGNAAALAKHNVDLTNRTWEFTSPISITDKLRTHLASEMSGLEWEMLDEGEFRDDQKEDEGVLIGGGGSSGAKKRLAMHRASTAPNGVGGYDSNKDNHSMSDYGNGRVRGTSGWMKLKSRAHHT